MADAAHLAWAATLGCLEINPWPVRSHDVDHPDELRVDLDPTPGVAFADVAFPEQRIAIEVDGRRHHADRFEEDRLRQNEIVLRGWRVLRFTWKMLTERQDLVLSRIVQLLAA